MEEERPSGDEAPPVSNNLSLTDTSRKYKLTRRGIWVTVLALFMTLMTFAAVHRQVEGDTYRRTPEGIENTRWIATSGSWVDRALCGNVGLCGLSHLWNSRSSIRSKTRQHEKESRDGTCGAGGNSHSCMPDGKPKIWSAWTGKEEEELQDGRVLKEIPQFVLDYAPLVHLYSGEEFWPSDVAEHLEHVTAYINNTAIGENNTEKATLSNLDQYNSYGNAEHVFLHSDEDIETRPDWLRSRHNIPVPPNNETGHEFLVQDPQDSWQSFRDAARKDRPYRHRELRRSLSSPSSSSSSKSRNPPAAAGRPGFSAAPAMLVLVDKGDGVLDAFWFFFYSYNLGNVVPAYFERHFGARFGNHVGDWEHAVVRFERGEPATVFVSEHTGGKAYDFEAVEKIRTATTTTTKDKGEKNGGSKSADADVDADHDAGLVGRPVVYSAEGSHAMYATSGTHPYIAPWGLLHDVTDRGPLWDPALNVRAFHYDMALHDEYQGTLRSRSSSNSISGGGGGGGDIDDDDKRGEGDGEERKWRRRRQQLEHDVLRPARENGDAATGWFHFAGHWGDREYDLGDARQYRLAGEYCHAEGPVGPRFKTLGRGDVCQEEEEKKKKKKKEKNKDGRQEGCRVFGSLEEGDATGWLGREIWS